MPAGSSREISVRSAPAENARPAPATTTQRLSPTAGEASASSKARSSADERAFSFSGRLSTSVQTAPSRRITTSSATGGHPLGERPLAAPRQGHGGVLRVELAGESVTVEDGVRDQ